jgi:cytochrome c553
MRSLFFAAAVSVLTFAATARAKEAKAIWDAKCAGCHGDKGDADTKMGKKVKMPDFTKAELQTKVTDDQLHNAIAKGVKDSKMKPFEEKLSPQEIDSLVKYIRQLGGAK